MALAVAPRNPAYRYKDQLPSASGTEKRAVCFSTEKASVPLWATVPSFWLTSAHVAPVAEPASSRTSCTENV